MRRSTTATGSLHIKKRTGSGCSPEMKKTARKTSLELQPPSGFLNPSPCFSMARLSSLTGRRVSRFQLLQQDKGEPVYAVFDCLFHEGKDLRREPLSTRRAVMERSIGSRARCYCPPADSPPTVFTLSAQRQRRGYEGLVAKDLSSPYVEARSTKWLKVKVHQEDEFVIAGFTRPAGSRQYFGALLLGAYDKHGLRYVGKVGTGFDQKTLAALYRKFRPFVTISTCAVGPSAPEGRGFSSPTANCPDLVPRMDG